MNCNVGAYDMVDCNVTPWDVIFDDDDVIEMANCDNVLLKTNGISWKVTG